MTDVVTASESGRGSRTRSLIVLPGLDGTAELRSDFADAAREHFDEVRCIAYPNDRILDYDALENFVRAVLPTDIRFILVGESFSGPLAISIAARPPPGLAGLVLSTTFASSAIRWLKPLAGLIRVAPVGLPPAFVLDRLLLGSHGTESLRLELHRVLRSIDRRVLRSRAALALRVNVDARLPLVRVPVLYLRGTRDRLLPTSTGSKLVAAVPDARLIDIEGPHLLLQAQPQVCTTVIAEFAQQPTACRSA